jgi:hypothetical protein
MAHSKEYLEELKKLHNIKSFGRASGIPKLVSTLFETNEVTSMLDFGAGKGNTSNAIKESYPNINLYTYDPVTFPIELPKQIDLVYSSDVLEHVEPNLIDSTIIDLFQRGTKYQYHLIACHPAKKSLSDGRNAHLIIEEPEWWENKITSLCPNWKIISKNITEGWNKVKKGGPVYVKKYIVLLKNETSI